MSENSALNRSLEMNQIEHLLVSSLIPYARNSRTHSDEQVSQIAGSIREFGFTNPVLIDADGTIIAGHGRVMAAKKLGLETVPCIRLGHLTPSQVRAYVIADNKLALNAGWDDQMLRSELESLQEDGFNMDLTGFSDEELAELLEPEVVEGETDPDQTPEVPVEPITKLGDVWILGNHRLMCGDSTSIDAVQKMMNGSKADMVFTDPPYGVSVVKDGKVGADFGIAKKGQYAKVIGDDTTQTAHDVISLCQSLQIPIQVYWGGNYYADKLPPTSCWLVWDKRGNTGIVNTFADCELAWTNMTGPARIHKQLWNGMIREGEKDKRVHPTQKPVALAEWAISQYLKGSIVLDLFLGSGSTLIACEKLKKSCYGMEMSPEYCDVIVKRWEDFTGKKAVLEKA
jgi:DNA modification methylase